MDTPAAAVAGETVAAGAPGWFSILAITALIGAVTVWGFFRKDDGKGKGGQGSENDEEEEEDDDTPPVYKEIPAEYMPEGGVFTIETLAPLNGVTLPLCMGVCGKVINVSTSQSIKAGNAGYGALWAGREATYSLATTSLKPEDVEKMDYTLADLTPEQRKALAGWYKHFTTKYVVVGSLKEYDGWDFSEIFELAKDQNPFGAGKAGEGDAADANAAEAPTEASTSQAPPPQEIPKDSQVFNKGDRVQLQNLVASPDLNGTAGILEDYNPDKGRFVVRLEALDKVMLFKPENLLVLKDSS